VASGSPRSRRRIISTRCGKLSCLPSSVSNASVKVLGEQFEEPRVIGLGMSLRTKERLLEIWIKDGRNEKVRANVSNKMRQFLKLDPDNVTLYYKDHMQSIQVTFLFYSIS
jgi:hypothetical protein